MKEELEKYYYFPTMTKNIMFVREEKYICLDSHYIKIKKYEILTLHNFKNNDWRSPIEFKNDAGEIFRISCWDCGSFISLKKYRKIKLEKIKKASN